MNELRILRLVSVQLILFLMVIGLIAGCAAGPKNFGKDELNDEAGKIFESLQVLLDHTYYYCGSETKPDAILSVNNSFVLTSHDLWSKAAPDGKKLKYWVESMHDSVVNPPYGYFLLTPDGKRIGAIYTRWAPGPVEMEKGNRVSIYLPRKDIEKQSAPRMLR